MSKDSETDQHVGAALHELQAAVDEAPFHEIRALIEAESNTRASTSKEQEFTSTGIRGDFDHICRGLESLAERAYLADPAAIRQLVSLGEFIGGTLQDLGEMLPKSEPPHKPAPESSDKTASWSEKFDRALRSLLEAGEAAFSQATRELMSTLPEAEFIVPNRLLEGNEASGASAVLLIELCERLIQRRVNERRRRLLGEVAAFREVWPLLIGVPDFTKNEWVRDRMGGAKLATSLNLPERIRDADSPSAFVTPIYLQLEKVRREPQSPIELKDLQRVEKKSSANELSDIIKGLKRAKKGRTTSKKNPPRVYHWRSLLESGWGRKAALLPDLSKSTIPKWVEAGYWLCAFLCDGDFDNYPWPASQAGSDTSEGGVKKLLRAGFARQEARSKRKASSSDAS